MNTITINGVNINVDQVAMENKNLKELKEKEIFAEDDPSSGAAYERLFEEVQKVQAIAPEIKVEITKKKKAV